MKKEHNWLLLPKETAVTKALQKFYKLWYFTTGQDSAKMIAEKNTVGMQLGFTISENAQL